MNVRLTKPRVEQFIREQVDAGHFPSAQAAVEAAVEQMMTTNEWTRLTEGDVAAIAESDAQFERGECVDFDVFAADLRRRIKGG